jgi:hypothetical protein
MANIQDGITGSILARVDAIGNIWNSLKDRLGNTIARRHREKLESTFEALMVAGKNDEFATALRTDRK